LFASRAGAAVLDVARVPVLREGNVLVLPRQVLDVAEACSGIRSLVSLITLAVVLGEFTLTRRWTKGALALAAIPVAIGANALRVAGIAVYDDRGRPLQLLEPCSRIMVRISVRAKEHVPLPIVGFMLRNQLGIDFSGTNTAREGYELAAMRPGDIYTVDFHIDLPELYPASFSFSPAIADGTLMGYAMCDWIDNALALHMGRAEGQIYGFMHLPCRVEVNAPAGTGAQPSGEDAAALAEKPIG
jgi:exosortase/archaeosortase family protein